MEHLLQHIRQFYPLSAAACMALTECFEERVVPKGGFLLQENQVCRYMYFLQHGALRGYYLLDGREITHWFAFENSFVTSFHSFITGRPSVEYLQVLEGSMLWAISKQQLERLYNQHHEIERLVRIAYERYYILLEERYVNGHFKTALERYRDLLQHAPHIVERVPLGYISSYLGVTQETLSRIRKQR